VCSPLVGVKLMLIVGAALDMGIGVLLLSRAQPVTQRGRALSCRANPGLGLLVLALRP